VKLSLVVGQATRTLGRFRARTILAVMGIALSIATIVVLMALSVGANFELQKNLERMGRNLLTVNAGRSKVAGERAEGRQYETLLLADAESLRGVEGVALVAPVQDTVMEVRVGARTCRSTITGTTPEIHDLRNYRVVAGRRLDALDVLGAARVAVIGSRIIDDLFLGEFPIGERIHIDATEFTVVGVLARKGVSTDGGNEDNQILVPLSSMQRRMLNVDYLDRIYVQAVTRPSMPITQKKLEVLLRSRHGIRQGRDDDFTIGDQARLLQALRIAGKTISDTALAFAGLALLVGGSGILAVMLLSARQRTKEIGMRRATGALPTDVLLQFLAEALALGLTGGLVGVSLGASVVWLGRAVTEWELALDPLTVVVPLSLALCLSLLFAVYPAVRASRQDPIRALSKE
jgi:putative ABC transport system permease protein